jgi:hypothetical protein
VYDNTTAERMEMMTWIVAFIAVSWLVIVIAAFIKKDK